MQTSNHPTLAAKSRGRLPTIAAIVAASGCFLLFFFFLAFWTAAPVASRTQNQAAPPKSEFDRAPERATILDGLRLDPIQFQPPTVGRESLSGDAQLLLAGDDTLPSVQLSFYFVGGTQAEHLPGNVQNPQNGGAGSLEAALALLESGGGGERTGEEIAEELAAMGAKLKFEPGYEYWSANLTILKKDFDRGLEILEDLLLRPRMPAERLKVVQTSMLAQIQRRNDDPARIAARKMNELLFAGYRRGYSLQAEDVNALRVGSLRRDLNRRLRPGGLWIAASGDLAGLDLKRRLNRIIEQFPSANERRIIERETPLRAPRATDVGTGKRVAEKFRGKILLVNKAAAQSVINIAGYLPPRNSPDMYALQTGNYILGGGSFNSRLTREIRVRRGLAYYAYSYNDFDGAIGRFVAGSGTRTFLAHQTLALMLETIAGMQTPMPTTDLNLAQDAILNSLAFQFDSPEDAAFHAFRNQLHGMPENYLQNFPGRVRALDSAALSRVAKEYLRPQDLFVVVAGPAALKEKLETIRPVIVIEAEDLPEDVLVAAAPARTRSARH